MKNNAQGVKPPRPQPAKQDPNLRAVWKNDRYWVWKGELRLPDGSLKTCEDRDHDRASEKLIALRIRFAHITAGSTDTLYESALAWLKDQEERNRDTNTLANYRYQIEVSIGIESPGEHLGAKKPIEVSVHDMSELLKALAIRGGKLGRGLGYHNVAHIKSTLEQVLHREEEKGTLDRNVAAVAKLPGPDLLPKPRPNRAPSRQQVEDILEYADEKDPMVAQFIRLGMGLGGRAGEGLGVRWENVDWKRGRVALRTAVTRKVSYLSTQGVRTPETLVADDDLKTDESRRWVSLPSFSLDALRRRQETQEGQRAAVGRLWKEQGLVFTTETGGPISHSYMKKRLKKITDAVDCHPWSITALTRRTYATRVAMARDAEGNSRVSRQDLAQAMGHKNGNTRMVEQYYIDHDQLPENTATASILEDEWG